MTSPGARDTLPLVARCRPRTVLIRVVLPAPLGPMMVMMSPRCTVRVTLSTTTRFSNRTVTFSRVARASVMGVSLLAARAQTGNFQGNVVGTETFGPGGTIQSLGDFRRIQFEHVAALPADEESTPVELTGVGAADKRIERRNPVHQAVLLQKVQSPVHRGRGCFMTVLAQAGEDVVGPEGFVGLPDQLQHPFADRR